MVLEDRVGRAEGASASGWACFVGLATLDVVQQFPHWPGPDDKVTARWHELPAGGPATNAALAHTAATGTLPIAPVAAAYTLGAGDVFHGAYVHAVARGGMKFPEAFWFDADAPGERVQVRGQIAWLEKLRGFSRTGTARR